MTGVVVPGGEMPLGVVGVKVPPVPPRGGAGSLVPCPVPWMIPLPQPFVRAPARSPRTGSQEQTRVDGRLVERSNIRHLLGVKRTGSGSDNECPHRALFSATNAGE